MAQELYICWKQYLHNKFKILHNPGGAGIECTPATDNIMLYNPEKHHRKSIRLKGYDYSRAGACFVTICVQDRECWFGEIIDGNMNLNDAGKMVHNWWNRLPQKFSNIELDELIVMPNHLHGILILRKNAGASLVDAPINAKNITPPETIQNDDLNDLSGKIYLDEKRAGTRPAPTNIGLADMIGSFKSLTTNEYIKGVKNSNWPQHSQIGNAGVSFVLVFLRNSRISLL